jgi:signal transduction histidine kinase
MLQMKVHHLVLPEEPRQLNEHLTSEPKVRCEVTGFKKDQSEIFLEISSRNVVLKGKTVSLMAVRDITQRKQLEAQVLQQDRLASLGLLASSLAHEIGTPMGVIRGRAEMMLGRADDLMKTNLDIIITQIDRITKLIQSLLQLARGSQSDAVVPVDIRIVMNDVIQLMSHELERKNIRLETKVVGNTIVKSEAGPLGQVLLNLLVNSVHAIVEAHGNGRQYGHRIYLNVEDKGKEVEISLNDTGCGISEKNIPHLFKPFFTTKAIGVGTGLGLATTYKLVQSWGGSIHVESKVGEGTTFILRLPKNSA